VVTSILMATSRGFYRGLGGAGSYAARAFDQGLGRSVWFFAGADIELVGDVVASFAPTGIGPLERCRHGCHLYRGMQCGGDGKTRRGSGGTPGVLSARRCICRNCAISRRDCHGWLHNRLHASCAASPSRMHQSWLTNQEWVSRRTIGKRRHMKSGDHVSNPEFHLRVRGRRCLAPSIGWVDTTGVGFRPADEMQ